MEIVETVILSGAAAICFGNYLIPIKITERKTGEEIGVIFAQFVICLTILMESLLFGAVYSTFYSSAFTPFGILSGFVWTVFSAVTLFAIKLTGLTIAVGVWGSVSAIVSFFWGIFLFHEPIYEPNNQWSLISTIIGIVLVVLGILVISALGFMISKDRNWSFMIAGIVISIFLGIINGSSFVPMEFANYESSGIAYIPSFGLGMIFFLGAIGCANRVGMITLEFPDNYKQIFVSIFASGTIVLCGFIFLLGSLQTPLGYTIGFPISQSAILVYMAWETFYFKVFTKWYHYIFLLLSGITTMVGFILLANN